MKTVNRPRLKYYGRYYKHIRLVDENFTFIKLKSKEHKYKVIIKLIYKNFYLNYLE